MTDVVAVYQELPSSTNNFFFLSFTIWVPIQAQ